jgi:hypothetical protein
MSHHLCDRQHEVRSHRLQLTINTYDGPLDDRGRQDALAVAGGVVEVITGSSKVVRGNSGVVRDSEV